MKEELSPRQTKIVAHIANGITLKKIAEMLAISKKTVEKHRSEAGKKLKAMFGLSYIGIAEITHYAIANNLVELRFARKTQ